MANGNPNSEITSIPRWFYTGAIMALVWNLLGVMAFIRQVVITPEMLAKLPLAEQDLYTTVPLWVTMAFAVAVFSGALASLALIMKKSICYQLFVISFIGVLLQMFHTLCFSNAYDVNGPSATLMPIMAIVIALGLVRFAAKGNNNNWFS